MTMKETDRVAFIERLRETPTTTIEDNLDRRIYNEEKARIVERELERRRAADGASLALVELQQQERVAAATEESNAIARQANRHANIANVIAVGALLVAAIALLVALGTFG